MGPISSVLQPEHARSSSYKYTTTTCNPYNSKISSLVETIHCHQSQCQVIPTLYRVLPWFDNTESSAQQPHIHHSQHPDGFVVRHLTRQNQVGPPSDSPFLSFTAYHISSETEFCHFPPTVSHLYVW
jgi:hypothetical protein